MNAALSELIRRNALHDSGSWRTAIALGLMLVQRVRHLLEDPAVIELLDRAGEWSASNGSREDWLLLCESASGLASSHPGSRSIDGTAHAAVSATYSVAHAVRGRVNDAAAYAAYAAVYAYSGSAVTDPEAFVEEHAWQLEAARAFMAHRAA